MLQPLRDLGVLSSLYKAKQALCSLSLRSGRIFDKHAENTTENVIPSLV